MVQYFNTQVPFPNLNPRPLRKKTIKMSDINATRLPIFSELIYFSYVGDDVSRTLTRGERWAQHLFQFIYQSVRTYMLFY